MNVQQPTKKPDFKKKEGFGFIVPEPNKDYFVHFSAVQGSGFQTLKQTGGYTLFTPASRSTHSSDPLTQDDSKKISAPSQTLTNQDEDALALLMSDDECSDDVIEDASVLCSVDHESGRITDPIRRTWDAFGTYSHLNNGRVEGPFNINASRTDDKKIIDCRAELNQLIPFKYTWAWDKHLTGCSSGTALISDMLTQDSTKEVDIQLKKMVETCDTYIPEPLRNADGTPIYVDENEASTSNDSAYVSGVGMFAQKADQQQDSSRTDSLMHGDSSFSNAAAGATK